MMKEIMKLKNTQKILKKDVIANKKKQKQNKRNTNKTDINDKNLADFLYPNSQPQPQPQQPQPPTTQDTTAPIKRGRPAKHSKLTPENKKL